MPQNEAVLTRRHPTAPRKRADHVSPIHPSAPYRVRQRRSARRSRRLDIKRAKTPPRKLGTGNVSCSLAGVQPRRGNRVPPPSATTPHRARSRPRRSGQPIPAGRRRECQKHAARPQPRGSKRHPRPRARLAEEKRGLTRHSSHNRRVVASPADRTSACYAWNLTPQVESWVAEAGDPACWFHQSELGSVTTLRCARQVHCHAGYLYQSSLRSGRPDSPPPGFTSSV